MAKPLTPSELAFAAMLRILYLKIARLEGKEAQELREEILHAVNDIPIFYATPVEQIELRAEASSIVRLVLAMKGEPPVVD